MLLRVILSQKIYTKSPTRTFWVTFLCLSMCHDMSHDDVETVCGFSHSAGISGSAHTQAHTIVNINHNPCRQLPVEGVVPIRTSRRCSSHGELLSIKCKHSNTPSLHCLSMCDSRSRGDLFVFVFVCVCVIPLLCPLCQITPHQAKA